MEKQNHISAHDAFATTYDSQVKEYHSHGHDVLFGMCYEYVKAAESLLDLGIGTGLSSMNFARVGLKVTGLDGSTGMLDECRKKNFAKELRQYDLEQLPLPFPDGSFHHVICCGVFHFFTDLSPLIQQVARVVMSGGLFAFTIASPTPDELKGGDSAGVIQQPTAWGISISKHSDSYINRLAQKYDFNMEKEQKVVADSGDKNSDDILFKAIVMKKT